MLMHIPCIFLDTIPIWNAPTGRLFVLQLQVIGTIILHAIAKTLICVLMSDQIFRKMCSESQK